MAANDFRLRLGRIRSQAGGRNQRYLTRIAREINRAAPPKSRSGRSSYSGSRSGRGYASAVSFGSGGSRPGRRRVVVKARITKFKGGGIKSAQAHLRYLKRDGVTREGEPGALYNEQLDNADGKAFLQGAKGDRHQFRLIVAPEDSAQLADLKPFVRDLMHKAETDLGTSLDWVAVDHFNTGHPHSHVVIRGRDDRGGDLVIARDYVAHGFRERARDLVTLELGPETQAELDRKLQAEMTADRLTGIDRSLLRDVEGGVLQLSAQHDLDQRWQTLKTGRLRHLETLGLADELKPAVWRITDRTEAVLRDLGQRNDIMKTMQRAMTEANIERGTRAFSIFKADDPKAKVVGKIVGMGLADEMKDHHYALIDGVDGKLHYAEIGRLDKHDPPGMDLLVTIRGHHQGSLATGKSNSQAQLFIESHASFTQLATANGATWLDRQLVSKQPERLAAHGFGAEVGKALRRRQKWLVQETLMSEQGGQLIARRKLLAVLTRRDVEIAGAALEAQLGLKRVSRSGIGSSGLGIAQTVRLVSGRFAVLQGGKEFALVPWRHGVRKTKGLGGVGGDAKRGMSR